MRINRELNIEDRVAFEHFDNAVAKIERVIDKIVAKKAKQNSNSKRVKRFMFCVVIFKSDDDNDNNNNNDDNNFFFQFCLAYFIERMTTIYVVNVVSNNCLIVAIKDANALKKKVVESNRVNKNRHRARKDNEKKKKKK